MTAPTRPVVGDPLPWSFPAVEEQRLDGGLRLLTCHLPGKPVATVEVLADLPVDTDPLERAGLAVLTARSLDEGTRRRDGEAFAAALERQGATLHAGAGYEGLTVAVDVPVSRLAGAVELLAEAVREPAFAVADVERVRAQRLDQITQELANPASRAAVELAPALHAAGTRGALPSGGTAATVAAVEPGDLARAHSRIGAATTTVVVAGDLTGLDVAGLVEPAFAGWAAGGARTQPSAPQWRTGPRLLVVDRPDAVQTQLLLAHPLPDRRSPDWPDLVLAAYVLGGTLTSRIDALLREERGVTYGIRASAQAGRRGGTLTVSGSVDSAATADSVVDLVGLCRTAVDDGVTAAEVSAASRFLVGVSPLRWETPGAVAAQLVTVVGHDLEPSWIDGYLEGLRAASAGSVTGALRRHLDPGRFVVVAVGPEAGAREAAERLGIDDVAVVRA